MLARRRRPWRCHRHRRLCAADVTFAGTAGHAGTTPMEARDDALCRAAGFVLQVRDAAGPDAVGHGRMAQGRAGAANVIPSRVELAVDARALEARGSTASSPTSASSRTCGSSQWR